MSPNPVVLFINAVNVKKWFASKPPTTAKARGRFEHRDEPVPGYYEYRPGRGLLLVAVDEDDGCKLDQPVRVIYSKILHRNMLEPEYKDRQRHGTVADERGKKQTGTFFRMDDGFTWIYWRDQYGNLDLSPRRRKFCIDTQTGRFRPLTAADCVIDGDGLSYAASSVRVSVTGDVHAAASSAGSLSPASTPRTAASSHRGSGADAALRAARTRSSASTPTGGPADPAGKLDRAELDRRLRRLASP